MNAQQQLQLEDAQKKLSIFRKHLDLLARCTGESKNVDSTEVLSAVSELQSLVQWAALQPELGEESAVLLMKLQELHQIRESLEKTATNTNEYSDSAVNDGEEIAQCENYSESIDCIPNDISTNLCDSNEENNFEDDSLSIDKDSLGELSASTEDPNLAKAESPVSIEDGHVDTIPIDDKTENTTTVDETNKEDPLLLDTQEVIESSTWKENPIVLDTQEVIESLTCKEIPIVLDTQEVIESPTCEEIPIVLDAQEVIESSTCKEIPDEIKEVQEVSCESKAETDDLSSVVSEIRSPDLFRSEVIIIETDEEDKSSVWVDNSKSSNDPLDVCMYAIRNLYESLRLKENELLKLSAMQSDEKHIEALQAVIIDFHKDITNLNNKLEKSHKENMALKEQVLELEEAENDARLEAQKLEQKLVFLQEKDSHSQSEITQLKQSLKKSSCTITEKEAQEKEMRSQLKYMETLVQQYEDQIKVMESKEANYKKNVENVSEKEIRYAKLLEKRKFQTKGTQTYDPRPVKVDANGNAVVSRNNSESSLNIVQNEAIIEKNKTEIDDKAEAEDVSTYVTSSTSDHESDISKEQEKDLLKRLHKLIDEDVSLQQQIHYVDEINLAMWKKLQNLDDHIGECKRQNINETTNPVIAEDHQKSSDCEPPEKAIQDTNTITTNPNIPEENSDSLDLSEKYIEERLAKLEEVNAAFEKELQVRENLYKEKERKCEEWTETENRITNDLKRLAKEKEWIDDQISKFNREKDTRQKVIHELQEEINVSKEKYEVEISKVKKDQEAITTPLNFKVNQMLITEKDILKMITNLKSEKNRSHGRSELEKLKCNYIELQLELSQVRDEIRRIEEQFKLRYDQWTSKYLLEETQKKTELERLRSENARNENIISNLENKQKGLTEALTKQELYLEQTRENYKKSLEKTEEKHLSVETELQNQLQQIEEETTVATSVLVEERKKVEKELQEDIQDLRAKEEVYKTKIAELERDVIHLHDELHKIEAESKSEISDFQGDHEDVEEVNEYEIEVPCSKEEALSTASHSISVQDNSKPVVEITIKQVTEEVEVNNLEGNKIVEKVESEDNVDELRAQVRELQSDLEKISQETAEMPPVQPVKPITTSSLKQTVGDIDYAEVDECSFEAYKKNLQNLPNSTHISTDTSIDTSARVKDVYKMNNPPSYKKNSKNQRVSSKQPVEENDYDEVLPRPTNFHVVQQVGPDTLLVGWTYVNPSVLDGFEVYLGNQVHERIYIPDRTKALISGLNLKKPTHLRIYALSRYGQMSEPAVLELPPLQDSNRQYFEDEEDEYRDFEDPTQRDHRPYSMEW